MRSLPQNEANCNDLFLAEWHSNTNYDWSILIGHI